MGRPRTKVQDYQDFEKGQVKVVILLGIKEVTMYILRTNSSMEKKREFRSRRQPRPIYVQQVFHLSAIWIKYNERCCFKKAPTAHVSDDAGPIPTFLLRASLEEGTGRVKRPHLDRIIDRV